MMKYLILGILLSCVSCADKSSFEHFPSNRWEKSTAKSFEFAITEAGNYDLQLDFSHVYNGLPLREVPVTVRVTMGTSEIHAGNVSIGVLNEQGEEQGDCTGDICDTHAIVFKNKKLAKGNYAVKLAQQSGHEILPNVIGVGISAEKSDQ